MKKMLFVLLGLASLNVYANGCGGEYQPATGTCRIIDSSGRQILYNVGRPQSSNSGSTQPQTINIKVPSKYGAWAINPKTGLSGGALEMNSLDAAKKEAIKTCERGGKNKPCKVDAWVRNGCIAVAQGKDGSAFFGITPPGMAEAEALRKCQERGALQCRIIATEGCSMPKF
nr:DUF4189 domain-containing protein [uncultured Neisseria sp.]